MKNSLRCVSYYINWEGQPEGGMAVTEPMMISENSSAVYGQKDFVFFTASFFFFIYPNRAQTTDKLKHTMSQQRVRKREVTIDQFAFNCHLHAAWIKLQFRVRIRIRTENEIWSDSAGAAAASCCC